MSTSEKTFWKFGLVIQKIFRSIETKILIKSYVTKEKEREREKEIKGEKERETARERERKSKRKRGKEKEEERNCSSLFALDEREKKCLNNFESVWVCLDLFQIILISQ